MAQIVPKLNLNKTPNLVQNNSLIFAKNIRLDVDSSIHRDYGIFPMSIAKSNKTDIYKTDYGNIITRIVAQLNDDILSSNVPPYYTTIRNSLRTISTPSKETIEYDEHGSSVKVTIKSSCAIVGVIPASNEFYLFINGSGTQTYEQRDANGNLLNPITTISVPSFSTIIRYDEKEDKFYPCNCNWNYSGGTITGCLINNLLGEKILTIGEYNSTKQVPLKCINLSKSNIDDDEQIYTQTPNIPITNLDYQEVFNYVIPNGVYQFFVRYKIRDNFYTDWFPASRELFAGNNNIKDTSFGTVKYINTHRDSDFSFKLKVNHLYPDEYKHYESFQVGFILSHDDAIYARAWKHFPLRIDTINFDYNAKDAEEIEVVDLIKYTYQIYNVGNITSFKNKLYVSNYTETNFNEDLQELANSVVINIRKMQSVQGYGEYNIVTDIRDRFVGLYVPESKLFSGENGIIYDIIKANEDNGIANTIKKAVRGENLTSTLFSNKLYNIVCHGNLVYLSTAQQGFRNKHSGDNYKNFNFSTTINKIVVNGKNIGTSIENAIEYIYNTPKYLNDKCQFCDDKGKGISQITIDVYRNCTYDYVNYVDNGLKPFDPDKNIITPLSKNNIISRPDKNPEISTGGNYVTTSITEEYVQSINVYLRADSTLYDKSNAINLINYTTLIPYQKYKFYIHFIKQNGEITNGYYCDGTYGGIKEVPYVQKADVVLYPEFKNIPTDEYIKRGYVGCFFSIFHCEKNVATLYDIDISNEKAEANCLDIDLGLVYGNENITINQIADTTIGKPLDPVVPAVKEESTQANDITPIKSKEIQTNDGKYYYSSDASNIKYFGANGIVTFSKSVTEDGVSTSFNEDKLAYVVNDYVASEAEYVELTKCTPFIDKYTTSFSDYTNMNLLGYVCKIYKLDRLRTIKFYTDGSGIYNKKGTDTNEFDNSTYFKLIELKNHLGDTNKADEKITALSIFSTDPIYVYSNHNLNYISLVEDPVETFKSYYTGTSENTSDKAQTAGTMVLRLFKSLTMSSVYELSSMYKNYTTKTYSQYAKNSITRFDNTIRSSILNGDESSINIFKFDANDYYNIPTNKGIIVNLIAIGDAILVHTQDSMFKFSGSNTLQSSDGEIQPTENNVFDTGISEIFGSDFGFAGLQDKNDSIITELGYFFFDRDSRIIYMYGGQGQITKISDDIEKLFRYKNIKHIYFANDYYNNRIFISIMFFDEIIKKVGSINQIEEILYPVTLSFNVSKDIKAFTSLHDFYYHKAFNTKTNCYFLTINNDDVCYIDKAIKGCYTKLEITNDKLYPCIKENFTLDIVPYKESNPATYTMTNYDSIIDVIVNESYESIKTLNSISWISKIISSEFNEIDKKDLRTLKMSEELVDVKQHVPCKSLRVYSDTCISPLNEFKYISTSENVNGLDSNYLLNNYKYPRYNQGFWTFNYFRNIEIKNIINNENNPDNNNGSFVGHYDSDNNSLIEGKYFVIRFIFDNDFKLETISLNYNSK